MPGIQAGQQAIGSFRWVLLRDPVPPRPDKPFDQVAALPVRRILCCDSPAEPIGFLGRAGICISAYKLIQLRTSAVGLYSIQPAHQRIESFRRMPRTGSFDEPSVIAVLGIAAFPLPGCPLRPQAIPEQYCENDWQG